MDEVTDRSHLSVGLQTVPAVTTPVQLSVTGTLPAYLSKGTLFRLGPGRFEVTHVDGKQRELPHWFDGFALLQAFAIDPENNCVTYRSRFICDGAVRAAEAVKMDDYTGYLFGKASSQKGLLYKFHRLWKNLPEDPLTGKMAAVNVSTALQKVPEKEGLVARTGCDANLLINPENLEVEEFFSLGEHEGDFRGNLTAAHGQFDERQGEFWNYSCEIGEKKKVIYDVFKIKRHGQKEVMARIKDCPAYMHSLAMSENYVIIIICPMFMSGFKVWWNRSLMDGLRWDGKKTTKFYVVKKFGGGLVAKYEAPAFYYLHTINAFEKDNAIHIDLCRYNNADVLDQLMLDHMRTKTKFDSTTLTRFSLKDLARNIQDGSHIMHKASETVMNHDAIEFPHLNPKYEHKEYRYAYGVSGGDKIFSEVTKVDLKEGTRKTWSRPGGIMGGPVFVVNPNGTEEDDGVLLVVVTDANLAKSYMVVLDAKTLTELATATVPQIVPLSSHGRFERI